MTFISQQPHSITTISRVLSNLWHLGPHTKKCLSILAIPISSSTLTSLSSHTLTPPHQPQANVTINTVSADPTWLLDNGVSHHVTEVLTNLALHSLYIGSDDVMIWDGRGLFITHSGSTILSSQFTLGACLRAIEVVF